MSAERQERNTEIFREHSRGVSFGELARKYQITRQRAHAIVEAMRDREFLTGGKR